MINKHIIFAYVTKLCSVDIKFLAIGEKTSHCLSISYIKSKGYFFEYVNIALD